MELELLSDCLSILSFSNNYGFNCFLRWCCDNWYQIKDKKMASKAQLRTKRNPVYQSGVFFLFFFSFSEKEKSSKVWTHRPHAIWWQWIISHVPSRSSSWMQHIHWSTTVSGWTWKLKPYSLKHESCSKELYCLNLG